MGNYASTGDLAAQLRISDLDDGAELALALAAAEGAVEEFCHRVFWQTPSADPGPPEVVEDSRLFWPFHDVVFTDDIVSVSEVAADVDDDGTFAEVWDASDFRLSPLNAAGRGRPFTSIVARGRRFPTYAPVRVTGVFGWPAVPAGVKQAVLLQAARLYKRREAQFGIAGLGSLEDGGGVRLMAKVDADVQVLLMPFRRPVV